ncbi:hypothetical protein [Paraburkholderia fungorum]|jgi:putative transposase|uniref:Uncharacterized protein n=1 Tax=Paraburkholderia fungorum TaxID=134537 RepID=A0AAW3UV35_9BURK|nr:hypothetical protein [Paraburkholderia fungorum]MBB6202509.1 hypothetical protein [Paraburkholderia fungorum]
MKAACKLSADNGITKLKTHAAWLKADHPDASPTLLEGLGETFMVSKLGLTPALIRGLDDQHH